MSVQTITTPCASVACEDGNPSAVFIAMCEDVTGAPTAVLPVCGPCAAGLAIIGFTVKVRPYGITDDNRLAW